MLKKHEKSNSVTKSNFVLPGSWADPDRVLIGSKPGWGSGRSRVSCIGFLAGLGLDTSKIWSGNFYEKK
jgi:hypothetical protein